MTAPSDQAVILLVAAAFIFILVGIGLGQAARPRHARLAGRTGRELPVETPDELRPVAAVVVNPSKFDDSGAAIHALVTTACRQHNWGEPLWFETTREDPGGPQTVAALAAGADVVIACGGDGTVRRVADALAGQQIPLALLPSGTGNLLARNLGIDPSDRFTALEVALHGDDRPIDVGRIKLDDAPVQTFLVMAGMGLDGDIMLNAPEQLKAAVGPAAYAVSGARHLNGPRTRVGVEVDGVRIGVRRLRAVIVGNCGKLVGGLVLMPDAKLDDGLLDAVSVAPRGVIGWGNVLASVLTQHRKGHSMFERWSGQRIVAVAATALPAEIDGDPVGMVRRLETWVDHRALTVRVRGQSRHQF